MSSREFGYDLFLAGPWEQYSKEKYKTLIKDAFPDKRIYDPETRPSQETGEWFEDNYRAIKSSERMVSYVCSIPFPGNAMETGMFYLFQRERGIYTPDKMVVIWDEEVKPDFGKEVISRYPSTMLKTTEEAIAFLREQFKK